MAASWPGATTGYGIVSYAASSRGGSNIVGQPTDGDGYVSAMTFIDPSSLCVGLGRWAATLHMVEELPSAFQNVAVGYGAVTPWGNDSVAVR